MPCPAPLLREEFELDPALTYLNWGTHSIMPLRILEAVQRYQRDYETNPTQGYMESFGRSWKIQQELAQHLGASAEDIFLRVNVTEALNDFLLGMPLEAGAEILATDAEYGAIAHQLRFRSETSPGQGHGKITVRTFELPVTPAENLSVSGLVDAIVAAFKPETRMLLVSHILTGNGLVVPIRELARETRKRGILLVVDGAHAPGAVPLELGTLDDVDFYGGNLHKWFMGPKGTAFGWVNRRHHATLKPLSVGWTTYERGAPFGNFGGGNEFALRMALTGCRDFAPFYAIHDAISFWREFGAASLRERLYEIQDAFRERVMNELGLTPLSPAPGPLRGPLAAYALPEGTDAMTLMARLYERHHVQVLVSRVKGAFALRLSPHFTTSEAELDRGIEALKAELARR